MGHGGGSGGGGGAAASAGRWPIIYEEIGGSRHFQIFPAPAVANGSLSILSPGNSGAILRVATQPDGTRVLQNTTMGNRVVAVVAPSSLIPGGFVLVSGELKNFLDEDFSDWRAHNRRPHLEDLVTPSLHFR